MLQSIRYSFYKKIIITFSLSFGICLGFAAPALAATYYIDPSAATNGTGTQTSPFNTWAFGVFGAGNTYLQKSGTTYNGSISISGVNSPATAPLQMGKYGTGAAPNIQGSISVDNSSYVTISDLGISNSTYAGIGIMNASHHVIVQRNAITNTGLGVWIGNGAGMNNKILNNYIFNNTSEGVAVDRVNCTPGNETYIQGNVIFSNYTHGIELTGNYYIIQSNTLYGNGAVTSGSSGIHVFSIPSTPGTYGGYNIIRNNISYRTHESAAYDGNGIELDLYTGYNQVYKNLVFSNDGAGIIVFDSTNNNVHDNTILNNLIDSSHTHVALYKGELVLGATTNTPVTDLTQNTTVSANTVISTKMGIAAMIVDPLTSNNPMTVGNNTFYHTLGDNFYSWASTAGNNETTWNTTLVPGGGDDQKSSVAVNNAAGVSTSTMDYVFEPVDQTIAGKINGATVKLIGWSAANGLYVQYPSPAAPTAQLTVNGVKSISLRAGDSPLYSWSSTNASVATSTFTENSSSCGLVGTGPYPWTASTLSGTSTSAILSCQAGHTYTFKYTVTNSLGVSASSSVTVTVLTTPVGRVSTANSSPNTLSGIASAPSTEPSIMPDIASTAAIPSTLSDSQPPTTTPSRVEITHTLAQGWTGSEVTLLQATLQKLGQFNASTTGYYGQKTAAAVSSFQRTHGLEPVGIVGPKTRRLLNQNL